MKKVDWTKVYSCKDGDTAAEVLGRKFRFILNIHAPWIKSQARKNFSPWLTDETKEMMKLKDEWNDVAKELSIASQGEPATPEEVEAWNQYKYFRNRINNQKNC